MRQILQVSLSLYKQTAEEFETVNGERQWRQRMSYLHNGISCHPIWKSRDFWETCIIELIYEKMWKNEDRCVHVQEKVQAEKNHILSILTQVSQNMLLFNFQLGAITDIMNKFCHFFALSEDLSQDLYVE